MNEVQELYLELVKKSRVGEVVVKDLLKHKDLWDSVFMMPTGVTLRDIPKGINNVDTLYILTDKKRLSKLKEVAKNWDYDLFEVVEEIEALLFLGQSTEDEVVVVIWWD